MNWESVNWVTLLWVGGIVLLIFFMMRGCGGMMGGGGCGMGGRRQGPQKNRDEGPSPHSPENNP